MESTSSKLHEELVRIHKSFTKDVNIEIKFLKCLRLLLPCFITMDVYKYWFGYYSNPALNSAGQPNVLVSACRDFILGIMLQEEDVNRRKKKKGNEKDQQGGEDDEEMVEDPMQKSWHATSISEKQRQQQLEDENKDGDNGGNISKTKANASKHHAAITTSKWILEIHLGISDWLDHIISQGGMKNQERLRFIRMNAKDLLIEYGHIKTSDFFTILNEKISKKETRIETLALLSVFVSQQPPYLYQIKNTALLSNLHNCLLNDISATALTVCANTLAMTLPHICDILAEQLPMLFSIYGRLACWHIEDEKDEDIEEEAMEEESGDLKEERQTKEGGEVTVKEEVAKVGETGEGKGQNDIGWEKLGHFFNLEDDDRRPSITPLFTFLYGLFPANLVSFLKKPSKYLLKASYTRPFDDFWDEHEIVVVSKPIFELHVLHPGLISTSAEEELNDPNRLNLLGSATDIASQCLGYYNQNVSVSSEHKPPEFRVPFSFSESQSLSDNEQQSYSNSNRHSYLYSDFDADIDPKEQEVEPSTTSRENFNVDILDKGVVSSDSLVYNSFGKIKHFANDDDVAKRQVVAPQTQAMDDLLNQHSQLFTKRSSPSLSQPQSPSVVGHRHSIATISEQQQQPELTVNTSTATEPQSKPGAGRLRARSGTLSSPGFFPVSSKSPTNTPSSQTAENIMASLEQGSSPRSSISGSAAAAPAENNAASSRSNSITTTTGQEAQHDLDSYDELKNVVSFYRRELLLLKNELDFVSFIEQHSQYRFRKMREQLSRKVINDESVRHLVTVNSDLKKRMEKLRLELSQSQRNTKTYRKERQKYENEIIKKSKEFRQNALDLKQEKEQLEKQIEDDKSEKDSLSQQMIAQESKISNLELHLAEAKAQAELLDCYKDNLQNSRERIAELENYVCESGNGPRGVEEISISNLQDEIDSLKLENKSLENEKIQQEHYYHRLIEDLNTQLSEQEVRPHKAQVDIMDMIERNKKAAELQYSQLKSAHDELSQRYTELQTLYRKHVVTEEQRSGRVMPDNGEGQGEDDDEALDQRQLEPQTSLLGFDEDNNQNSHNHTPNLLSGYYNNVLPGINPDHANNHQKPSRQHRGRTPNKSPAGSSSASASGNKSRSVSRSGTYRGIRI